MRRIVKSTGQWRTVGPGMHGTELDAECPCLLWPLDQPACQRLAITPCHQQRRAILPGARGPDIRYRKVLDQGTHRGHLTPHHRRLLRPKDPQGRNEAAMLDAPDSGVPAAGDRLSRG